jgi:RHS repeat-associated protein
MSFRTAVRVLSAGVVVALVSQMAVWGAVPAAAAGLPDDPEAVDPVAEPAAVVPDRAITRPASPGPTILTDYRLTSDETWGPQGSPYVLRGQTVVPAEVSLTLLPGTVVKFDGLTSSMLVRGQLLSLGLPDRRVVITSFKDDAVAGDTNGDGDASTPGRGDWGDLSFRRASSGAVVTASVIDYTDVRYGNYGSALACQVGMVSVLNVPITISNSNLSDAMISPLIVSDTVDTAPAGIYNNTFARAKCGLTSYEAVADVVGNRFESSLGRATYISFPKKVRFWFNTLLSQPTVNGGTVTRADADVRFNALLAGIDHWFPKYQDLQDWSGNWFGVDTRTPLPTCVTKAEAEAWIPAIDYVTGSGCPSGQVHPTGYRSDAVGSMTAAPAPVPASVLDALSPRVGRVDTRTGALSYSVTDLSIQDAGKELSATRSYRSDRAAATPGRGWSSSYAEAVSKDASGNAVLNLGDGDSLPFQTDPQAGYVPAQGVGAGFSTGTAGTSITTADRTTYQFSASGELDSVLMQDPDHKVTVRHANGAVSEVEGVSGRRIWFDRDAGRLSVVRDSSGRRAEFAYSGDRLAAARGVDGQSETYTYDGDGRLTRVVAPSGAVRLAAAYDGQGRVSWLEEQGSGRLEFTHDPDGHRTTTRYADGHTMVQQYDDLGRLVAETVGSVSHHLVYDAEGRQVADVRGVPTEAMKGYSALSTATFYNGRGDQVWQTDPTGVSTATTFSADHQPLVTTQSDGGKVTRTYDDDGRLTAVTDQLGGEYRYTYGRFGQVKSQTDALGRSRTLTYADDGDLATSTDEYGATTQYSANDRGKIVQITDPAGGVRATGLTSFDAISEVSYPGGGGSSIGYDADRRVTQVTTRLSAGETATTGYEYNAQGLLSAVVDAAGGRSTTEYNQLGLPVKNTDPSGAVSLQEYSDEGWLASSTDPLGGVTRYEHDPGGRDYRVTDPLGQITQTVWDRAGRPAVVWTPAGGKTTMTYDRAGRQTSVVTPLGYTYTTSYDLAGNPVKWKDTAGATSTATYDAVGRQVTYVNELGELVETSYDDERHRTTVSDALGVRERTTLNSLGLVASRLDSNGGTTHYGYNADGLPIEEDGPAGTTHAGYDLAGRTISTTDAAGRVTSHHYDSLGRVTSSELAGKTTRFEYDPVGRVTKRTDAEGRTSRYSYDLAGNLTRSVDGLGHATSHDYDALHRLVKTTDPTGVTTSRAYDPQGRPAVTWDGLGASWVTSYDLDGNVIKTVDPAGVAHAYTYDRAGRMLTDRNDNAHFDYTWDKAGRLATASDPYKTTYTYDVRGRVTSTTNGLGKKTTTGYTATDDGQTITRTTPAGNATIVGIDRAGRIRTSTDPVGATVRLDWTADSKLEKVTLPRGGTYQYRYDGQGSLASETDPLGATTRYSHDATGLTTKAEYPSGRVVEQRYDDAGHAVGSTATRPGTQPDVRAYSYDDAGRLTQAAASGPSGEATTSWQYNTRGLLAKSAGSQGSLLYGYDLAHRIQSIAGDAGQTTTIGYDVQGNPARVRGPINLDLGHNKAGQLTSRKAVSPTTSSSLDIRSYDLAGNLNYIGGGVSHTLTFNDDGLLATDKSSDGITSYTYDPAGRLTQEKASSGTTVTSSISYTWDADGNRATTSSNDQTTTYTYDAADRLVGDSNGVTYAADPDGLATRQGGFTLDYNAFAELIGTAGQGESTRYTRDSLGRVNTQTRGGVTIGLAYHGLGTGLAGYSTAADNPVDVVTAPDGTLVGYAAASGAIQIPITNSHGDVEKVLANRTIVGQARYDAFGRTINSSGSPLVPLGYQASLTDAASGLVSMGARFYSPELGRFTQADTVVGDPTNPTSLNRYAYAFDSPTNLVDPSGRWPDWLDRAVGAATKLFKDSVRAAGRVASAAAKAVAKAGAGAARSLGSAGRSLGSQVRKVAGQAAKWAYDNREELAATAVSVAADVVVTGGCGVVTAGVGSVGCVLAGGFVGGAVYGAMSCPHDAGQAECILNNGEVGLASAGLGVGAAKVVGKAVRGFAETPVGRAVLEQLDGTPAAGLVRRVLGYADDGAAGTVERQVVRAGSRDTAAGGMARVARTQTNATKSGEDWTRVGRWMHPDEHAAMRETGAIQWSPQSGNHHVSNPASPSTYRDAPASDFYVEYEVPTSVLRPHSEGTSIVYGPNSLQARLPGRAQTGDVPFRNLSGRWPR